MTDVFTKYAGVKPLKDKKCKTVLNVYIKVVRESKHKPKIYRLITIKVWLNNKDILMYFTHNEGTSVIAERFIKTLKAKIYEKMTGNDNKSYLSYKF